jgi:hypothetical protein
MGNQVGDSKPKMAADILKNRNMTDGVDRASVLLLIEHVLSTTDRQQRVPVNYFSLGTLLCNLFTWQELQVYRGSCMEDR